MWTPYIWIQVEDLRKGKFMKKKINTFLYKPGATQENFGEYLCRKIINKLGFELNRYSTIHPPTDILDYILTGIGGFLNNHVYSTFLGDRIKKWYVWGSGVDCNIIEGRRLPQDVLDNKCIISLLRGPLTKEYYNIEDVPLGDPGYLVSYFFKFPKEANKKSVLINHYYDNVIKSISGVDIHLSAGLSPDKTGSFDNSFMYMLSSIVNANIVLTSSMHAAIVAYSYGVPFAMVAKREYDLANQWKWYDTLLNMGIGKKIVLCKSIEEGFAWYNSVKAEMKPITTEYQEKIIEAFPFK